MEDDVVDRLVENGFVYSEENIAAVLNTGIIESLGDCTDSDWSTIDYAISSCEDELTRLPDDDNE